MDNDELDRYHELVLNEPEKNVQQKKIYGLKYLALLTSFTIIRVSRFIIQRQEGFDARKDVQYDNIIAMTISFVISFYSSFIGHKKLFIGSFSLFSLCFLISMKKIFDRSLLLLLLIQIFRDIMSIQTYIQICGSWPSQFTRIMLEMIIVSELAFFIAYKIRIDQFYFIFETYLAIVPFMLLLIYKGVSSYKQPLTQSIHRDMFKAIFHFKTLSFTALFSSSIFLCLCQIGYLIWNFGQSQINLDEVFQIWIIFFALSILLQAKIRQLKQQPTLIFAFVILLLQIIGLLLFIGISKIRYMQQFLLVVNINIFFYCFTYANPLYQVILTDIQIKNLDFSSSYQQFVFIVTLSVRDLIPYQLMNNNYYLIPYFMGAVFGFGIIFYQILGFKSYFFKQNYNQVQEQELEASQI